MRNSTGFYIRSDNNWNERRGFDGTIIFVKCNDKTAWSTGVTWHHSTGGGVDFFCDTQEEIDKITELKNSMKNAKIKSKKAFWELVAQNCNIGKDYGYGTIPAIRGKYGWFVPSFGVPDAVFGLTEETAEFYQKQMR